VDDRIEIKMRSKKSSRNHHDLGASISRRSHNSSGYGSHAGGYSYPIVPSGYYGSFNPYSTVDRRLGAHNYDSYRRPDYGQGIEDKWRNTYPYVPTSYYYNNPAMPRHQPESIAFSEADTDGGEEQRENWGSKWEFIFSCVGLSVGIGNVWRFPKLAYENGGASFLIPYFIILVIIGKPMYYLELALGQFAQKGPIKIWKMCPIGIGVGIGQCVVSIIVAIYYNVILGYCLYYIFASFSTEIPWASCSSEWGFFGDVKADERCYVRNESKLNQCDYRNKSKLCETAAAQYFRKVVQGLDKAPLSTEVVEEEEKTYALSDLGNIGEIKWDIALCLLLSWTVVCLCLIKGIKSSGKVVYFSATFPYLLLITLMIYGLFQDGAMEGVEKLFIPRWDGEKSILDIQVWRKAAEQMFFSLSISWGGLFMFGSYNKFKHKVHITATVISSLDFVTSIIAGVLIFSILGAQSKQTGIAIEDLVAGGQGLAFIAYPDALTNLPIPQIWTVMFFFMLFLLGIDSEFALLETVLTCVYDGIPSLSKYKPLITSLLCASCFLVSLPCVSSSGPFIFQIMDDYGGGMSVLWIAIFEMICIAWIYGANKLNKDFNFMLDISLNSCSVVSHVMLVALWYIIPLLLITILVLSMMTFNPSNFCTSDGVIHYPDWVHAIGFFLVVVAAAQFPLWAFFSILYYLCHPARRLGDLIRPTGDWGPGDRSQRKIWQEKQRQKQILKGYDNPTLAYPYYNYAGYGQYHNHHI